MCQNTPKIVVAIDGPAGAGKSTVARQIAKDLGYIYIDTGAMYRALTLKAIRLKMDLTDEVKLTELAENTSIKLCYENFSQVIYLDDENVNMEIRLPVVSNNVSLVAKVPGVRIQMMKSQKALAEVGGVIMDGRDIGSFVLPNAGCKIFLTAAISERAKRRLKDLKELGLNVTQIDLERELAARDNIDSTREMAPLKPAPDAIVLDSTELEFDQVVAAIKEHIFEACSRR